MALYAMKHLQLKRKKDLCAAVEILTCAADGIAGSNAMQLWQREACLLRPRKVCCSFLQLGNQRGG